jgi:hypothetical protein
MADLAARNLHPDLIASLAASLRKAGLKGIALEGQVRITAVRGRA